MEDDVQVARRETRASSSRRAQALEASGHGNLEALAMHWRGAGEPARAAAHAAQVAEQASLAFDRAARLYRTAIQLGAGGEGRVWGAAWGW